MHGSGDDGRGNELSQSVRVAEGVLDAERDADGHWRKTWPTPGVGGPSTGGGSSKPRIGHQVNLADAVKGAGRWPTPMASDEKWRGTEATSRRRVEIGKTISLEDAVKVGGAEGRAAIRDGARADQPTLWPTPRASEWKGTGPIGSKSQAYRLDRHYLDATVQDAEQETGPLNPDWVEWLMGFPIGWTDLAVDEPIVLEGEPWPEDPSPRIPRMAKGVVRRKHRLMQLGNAVVPKIPEILGLELRDLLETVEEESR